MALNDLNQLYREVILDHAQHPRHFYELEHPTHEMELLNPTCGDAITVQVVVEEEIVKDIGLKGHGCSISLASASMMAQVMIHQPLKEAVSLVEVFNHLIKGNEITQEQSEKLQDAFFLAGIKNFPARYKCGILAWRAFEKAVEENKGDESE